MNVNNKHLATLLLGGAAAFGAYKYTKMDDEEKQKMSEFIMDKLHKVKNEAENATDTANNYINNFKIKGIGFFKKHFSNNEKHFDSMDEFWLSDPEEHDFPAANDYLELLFPIDESKFYSDNFRKAITIVKKAKDVLRASSLPLL